LLTPRPPLLPHDDRSSQCFLCHRLKSRAPRALLLDVLANIGQFVVVDSGAKPYVDFP
jgi:hypothetical protein